MKNNVDNSLVKPPYLYPVPYYYLRESKTWRTVKKRDDHLYNRVRRRMKSFHKERDRVAHKCLNPFAYNRELRVTFSFVSYRNRWY